MIGIGTGYDRISAKLLNPQTEYFKGRQVVKRKFVFYWKKEASNAL